MATQAYKVSIFPMIHIHVDNPLYKIFCALRAPFVRFFKPKRLYFLAPQKSLSPISKKFGFDRGLPIDRYYIEKFLGGQKQYIRGACLEVHDDAYIKRYGDAARITKTDILDIDTTNQLATVYGDLQNLVNIPDNSYDCLVITQTFGLLPDVHAAARECFRILKPGGTLLATFSSFSPLREQESTHWHFTPLSVKTIFGNIFQPEHVAVSSYGNVLSSQGFIVGLAAEELTREQLDHVDPWYALIMGLRATKHVKS